MNAIIRSRLIVVLLVGLPLIGTSLVVQAEPFERGPGGGQYDRRHGSEDGDYNRRRGGSGNMQMRLGILGQYLDIVNSYHEIASHPEKSVAFNLQQLEHIYRRQGKRKEIAEMYSRLLKESRSRTLRNLAYMKLSDAYRKAGQFEQAESLLQKALQENMKAVR